MLSKMRACIAGAYVLAHVRRAASPLGVMRPYMRARHRGRFSVLMQKVEFWGEYCDTENRPLCCLVAKGLVCRVRDPYRPTRHLFRRGR